MRSAGPIRTAKTGYLAISAAMCVLGMLLMAVPDFSAALLRVVSGILLILFGGVRLAGYFSRDLYRLAFQYDLVSGILLVLLGGILLVRPGGLLAFLSVIIGIFTLADGLFKIRIAIDAKRFGLGKWWLILAMAILAAACGLGMLLQPGEGPRLLMIHLGITLLAEGLLHFSTALTAVKIIKHQQPDVIEADCCIESEE